MKKTKKSILTLLMAVMMLFSFMPATAFATGTDGTPAGRITAFAEVDGITAPVGTTRVALTLPESLAAMAGVADADSGNAEQTVDVPVASWACEGYDAAAAGAYTFTPTLGELPYPLGEGVQPPTITVTLTKTSEGAPSDVGGSALAVDTAAPTITVTMSRFGLDISDTRAAAVYNAGDIAVINAIIASNGLQWTKADPADGSYVPSDWTGVSWSNDATDKRINKLIIPDRSLASALDVSGLMNLTDLWCYNNQITGLTLPSSLEVLRCFDNSLTGALDVSGLTNLNHLSCYNNQITDLGTLPSSLTQLWCHNNQITDLGALPASLTNLWCNNNQITDLGTLPSSLTYLDCVDNQITDLGTLPSSLEVLRCYDNSLTGALDLSGPDNLQVLTCNGNKITDLGTLPDTLTHLYCYDNSLTGMLDVSGLTNLVIVYCSGNQITDLGTLPDSLIDLYCENNQITDLDVSVCSSLTYLRCYNNPLRHLKLKNGYELTVSTATGGSVMMTGPAANMNFSSPSVTLTATPESNYTFSEFQYNPAGTYTTTSPATIDLPPGSLTVTPVFKLLVNAAEPAIDTEPQGITVNIGSSATLSVSASSVDGGTLSYQWYSNTANSNSGGTLISGAEGATYSPPTDTAGTFYYYVVVTNTNNGVNGSKTATATSNAAEVTVNGIPAITGLPKDYTLLVGQSVSWTPTPAGGAWSYDKDLLSMTQDGDTYTFKALKRGKAAAIYTVDGVPHTINITINDCTAAINASTASQTGDTANPLPWLLLMLAALAGCASLLGSIPIWAACRISSSPPMTCALSPWATMWTAPKGKTTLRCSKTSLTTTTPRIPVRKSGRW